MLVRFEGETKARLWGDDTIIFSIGKNDVLLDNHAKTLAVSPQEFEMNLRKLILFAKRHATRVILMETLPIDEKRVNPIPWLTTHSYKSEDIKHYNEIIKKVSEKENVPLIEIYSKLINTDFENLLEDGIHPNTEGHKFICEEVKEYLVKNKIIDLEG
ncbi:MAG: SGNH/GDSL hydrolase family protein [Candidatus Daviesbacteria bacterium]|nr:SGNH/GDSL hydrolase family protein [Candidatus Daviesbacteria bacterium]